MARTYHAYTTGDDAAIRRMWGNVSIETIAEELGVNKKSLEDHIRSMEPPLPRDRGRGGYKWEKFEDNALTLLAAFEVPVPLIATALQRGERSVKRRIHDLKKERINGYQH